MRGEIGSVEVSAIVAGRLLQAAGLAAWVLAHSGGAEAASACREIQDVVDDALSTLQFLHRVQRRRSHVGRTRQSSGLDHWRYGDYRYRATSAPFVPNIVDIRHCCRS